MARSSGYSIPTRSAAPPLYLPGASAPLHPVGHSTIGTSKLHTQVLGSIVGRRGAGITSLAGGDPTHHAMGHYGKKGLPGLDGGDFGGDTGGF
jgi:hypothetical protein